MDIVKEINTKPFEPTGRIRQWDQTTDWNGRVRNPPVSRSLSLLHSHPGLLCDPPRLLPNTPLGVQREVYYSSPSSGEFKNEWSYNFIPLIRLHGVDADSHSLYLFYKVCAFTDTLNMT